jgi:hypothetical protein
VKRPSITVTKETASETVAKAKNGFKRPTKRSQALEMRRFIDRSGHNLNNTNNSVSCLPFGWPFRAHVELLNKFRFMLTVSLAVLVTK